MKEDRESLEHRPSAVRSWLAGPVGRALIALLMVLLLGAVFHARRRLLQTRDAP